ncbi:glycopeptide [Mycena alexandri]|uniref:Glycopeptide n=1 Tax=Mycena alexandri TaxID=1745969 RepID=A0AAD6SA39_9AGAR|nr:glycopeptide [Mycena alexandri]KAJ7037290.1 glycopeptide [Mycena alexandri]
MFILKSIAVLAVTLGYALAESHTVHFTNLCKFGTPTLIQGPNVLSTGGDYTRQGPLLGAIAYLQTGGCGFNGEGCTLVELSLTNGFSSADISLIPPHAFSVTSGFGYYNGCDGTGTDCQEPNCPQAFENPDETWKQIPCPAANVNLAVTIKTFFHLDCAQFRDR